nr:hypothetical protein [Tanacetum cinerariifolium]
MRIEDIDSWDLDNSTWGGWGEVIGTVSVDTGAQESSLGEMGILVGISVGFVRAGGKGKLPGEEKAIVPFGEKRRYGLLGLGVSLGIGQE